MGGRIARVRHRQRVRVPRHLKWLLRHGRGWELEVGANGHCMFLSLLETLRLAGYTPLDLRRAVGAWMVRNQAEVLPGGMTLAATLLAEHGLSVEAYARRLVDPEAEAREDGTGGRTYPQGTGTDFTCCCRRAPPPCLAPFPGARPSV